MDTIPAQEQERLETRLENHVQEEHADVCQEVQVQFDGASAYVSAVDVNGDYVKLCRLTWSGRPELWKFDFYKYSEDRYEESKLPTGIPIGSPEDCFDCAAMTYLQPIG